MEKLTYKQAFDKITEAYIKGEIQPMKSSFCFCGTLCPYGDEWNLEISRDENFEYTEQYSKPHPYTMAEYKKMELSLFRGMSDIVWTGAETTESHPLYEDALFNGLHKALETCKQIHKERGENVEDFQFTKRQNICHNKQK